MRTIILLASLFSYQAFCYDSLQIQQEIELVQSEFIVKSQEGKEEVAANKAQNKAKPVRSGQKEAVLPQNLVDLEKKYFESDSVSNKMAAPKRYRMRSRK